jgi:DNA-binding NarL/FixJ family response regulator
VLKIVLADNQAIFRAGAAKVLAVEDDFRVVAQADSLDKLKTALENFRPSVLIYADSLRPKVEDLVNHCKKLKTRIAVVVDNDEASAAYMQAGVAGVMWRNVSGAALVECVRKISKGESWVQDIQSEAHTNETDAVGARVRDRLTAKELKIVSLIVQGYKNKEIASKLGTTEQVIKNYLRNVYDKIGVSDRLELALFTIHHRILAEAAAAATASAGLTAPIQ